MDAKAGATREEGNMHVAAMDAATSAVMRAEITDAVIAVAMVAAATDTVTPDPTVRDTGNSTL
jgi:hypothetical protein